MVRAFAKVNLTLRILARRPDGFHEVRTILQTLALHDTLTFSRSRGPFAIECSDPSCPTDRTNLVWRAAELVWRACGRRGDPRGVVVRIEKRIPLQSGLGGGSSDAAAAIRALSRFWNSPLSEAEAYLIAGSLGADVPFFLAGGTALGLERGELIFPMADVPAAWLAIVVPRFGVSTKDAYAWWDEEVRSEKFEVRSRKAEVRRQKVEGRRRPQEALRGLPPDEFRNDLELPVAAHHAEISRIVRALRTHGAHHAAMSGSGSAVFGLFVSRRAAMAAARALKSAAHRLLVTRTLDRARYESSVLVGNGRRGLPR